MSAAAATQGAAARRLLIALLGAAILALGVLLIGQGVAIHAKAALAQVLLERAFDRSAASGRPVKPWPWADTWPVAKVEVPRLGKSAVVLAGASGQALAFGPGQVAGAPRAGDLGTAVYAAHRDTHFAFLGQVRPGDEIVVRRTDGNVLRFRVDGARVARWDASGVNPHSAGRSLVLATCWPLDGRTRGPLRYLVHAALVERRA